VDFVQYDLGQLLGGQVVEVALASAANVQLLDSANFANYRAGQRFQYYGGHVTSSPYRIRVPRDGYWHLAIDLGGASGQVRASVAVLGRGA